MKLYTRTGDGGETSLAGGQRVAKHDLRVRAYGNVDETNAAIGLAVASCGDAEMRDVLRAVQTALFTLGAELANPGGTVPTPAITAGHIARQERWIDDASAQVSPLTSFVLPGGSETAARLHVARTVCRRAERTVVELAQAERVDRPVLVYLNRLSDLLFALARLANHRQGVADIPWDARTRSEEP